jgi:hypothetical protein
MKLLILVLAIAISSYATAQIKVPSNFYLVKGASPVGRDDYFTDGQYVLSEGTPFQGGMPATDGETMSLLTKGFGFYFNKTREGFYVGSGYSDHKFKYVVIVKGLSYVLTSPSQNKGFATYSKWLLNQLRFHISEGDRNLSFK